MSFRIDLVHQLNMCILFMKVTLQHLKYRCQTTASVQCLLWHPSPPACIMGSQVTIHHMRLCINSARWMFNCSLLQLTLRLCLDYPCSTACNRLPSLTTLSAEEVTVKLYRVYCARVQRHLGQLSLLLLCLFSGQLIKN